MSSEMKIDLPQKAEAMSSFTKTFFLYYKYSKASSEDLEMK